MNPRQRVAKVRATKFEAGSDFPCDRSASLNRRDIATHSSFPETLTLFASSVVGFSKNELK